jgi:hypothetical protein
MIVLIMIMYPAKSGTPFSVVFKMFLYMFGITLLVVFLHDGILKYVFEEEASSKSSENFMRGTTIEGRQNDPAYGNSYIMVNPQAPQSTPIQGRGEPQYKIQYVNRPVSGTFQEMQPAPLQQVQLQQVPDKSGGNTETNRDNSKDNNKDNLVVLSYVEGGTETLTGAHPPQSSGNPFSR